MELKKVNLKYTRLSIVLNDEELICLRNALLNDFVKNADTKVNKADTAAIEKGKGNRDNNTPRDITDGRKVSLLRSSFAVINFLKIIANKRADSMYTVNVLTLYEIYELLMELVAFKSSEVLEQILLRMQSRIGYPNIHFLKNNAKHLTVNEFKEAICSEETLPEYA